MEGSAPTFELVGDGRLSDEAIEALAALLLSVADADNEVGVPNGAKSPLQLEPHRIPTGEKSATSMTKTLRLPKRKARR